jgi:aryl-alcohol dehydrogenase-like predicted oxidoreductase
VISTKGAHYEWGAELVSRVNAEAVAKDLEASLRALGREQIELYWLHRDHEATPVEEIVDFMESLVSAGKIRHWGVSNWKTGRMAAARAYAARAGVKGLVANQPFFNLGVWTAKPASDASLVSMDAEMLAWHVREGVAMMPYSAQAAGFFTKAIAALEAGGTGRDKLAEDRYATPANWRAAAVVRELAKVKETNANGIVLAYVKQQSVCSVPLVGCQNLEQLRDSVAGAAVVLSTSEMERLDKTAMAFGG